MSTERRSDEGGREGMEVNEEGGAPVLGRGEEEEEDSQCSCAWRSRRSDAAAVALSTSTTSTTSSSSDSAVDHLRLTSEPTSSSRCDFFARRPCVWTASITTRSPLTPHS